MKNIHKSVVFWIAVAGTLAAAAPGQAQQQPAGK
jgi:hypothetical protein